EDLVDDPRRALRRIVDALDLGPADLAFVSGRSATVHPAHTVAGNPMRFEQGTLHLRLDDEWRTRMPLASLRLVTALTRPLLSRYGYDVSPVTPDRAGPTPREMVSTLRRAVAHRSDPVPYGRASADLTLRYLRSVGVPTEG